MKAADVYRINPDNPSTIDDVTSEMQKIEDDLDSAMCGGWDPNIKVDGLFNSPSNQGKVANVKDVPGRTGNPLGNVMGGMGVRNEAGGVNGLGFLFPDNTTGLQSLCRPAGYTLGVKKPERENQSFFCEHPCQRPLDDIKPQNSTSGYANCGNQTPNADGIRYTCGGGSMKGPGQNIAQEILTNGPTGGLCEDLNDSVYALHRLYLWTCVLDTPAGPVPVPIYAFKKGQCNRQDLVSTDNEPGPTGFGDWIYQGKYECCSDSPYPGTKDNCVPCQGSICRSNPVGKTVIMNDVWVEPFPNDIPNCSTVAEVYRKQTDTRYYKSFYREYPDASFERDPLQEYVPDDSAKREEIPVACYGVYDTELPSPPVGALKTQEDAKIRRIDNKEKRCVIAAYYTQMDANFWGMKDSQKGKGHYGEDLTVVDDPFNDGPRDTNFDEDTDMWYSNIGAGFSLLNDDLYREQFKDDLTFALLSPDSTKMRASGQTPNTTGTLLSSGALLRAFDDTVSKEGGDARTIVEWWQALENEMHKRLSPPIMRVLLPAPWSLDLDPLDPLYSPDIPDPTDPPPEPVDPKLQSIEVQLHAGEDTLGDVVAFMERSLILRIREQPIQVMVPLASPTELRAIAHGWQNWVEVQESRSLPVDPKVPPFIKQLHDYADYLDKVRILRGELPRYIGTLLSRQKELTDTLAEWLVQNIDAYQSYITQREQLDNLRQLWQIVQGIYRRFHDIDAMPWCRNDRFTLPIYSLLDPWMRGRQNDGDLRGNQQFKTCMLNGGTVQSCESQFGPGLPYLNILQDPNVEVDFTAFAASTGSLLVPILKPVQIRMELGQLQPPSLLFNGTPKVPELPPVPVFPTIYEDIRNSYPTVITKNTVPPVAGVESPPVITVPNLNPVGVQAVLELTANIVKGMADEYTLFWDAAVDKPKPGTEQDCLEPHKDNCVHAEMDLWERVQRLAARPAIFLLEDFQSIGKRLDRLVTPYADCPTNDWVCHILQKTKKKPREGWQTQIKLDPDYQNQFNELIERVRTESDITTGSSASSAPQIPYDLDDDMILPPFRNPPDIILTQPRAAASSSSSS